MPLAFVTRSSQGTHDKVNGRFQSWTVINYRETQRRGAYVRMFGVLWTLVSLAAVYVSSHNRAPLQKGGALRDETKTAARETRSFLTRPQSSVFGSHTWPKGARGVMGRMKTKGGRRRFDPDSKSCARSFFLFSFYGKLCQLWITDLLLNRRTAGNKESISWWTKTRKLNYL